MQPLLRLQEQARLKALEAEASAKRKVLAGKRDRTRQLGDELKNMTAVSDAMREKLKRPTLQVTALAGNVVMSGETQLGLWIMTAALCRQRCMPLLDCPVVSLSESRNLWCQPACRHTASS